MSGTDSERPPFVKIQRVLLVASADNGLAQRTALALRRGGRTVRTAVVADEADIVAAVAPADFDVIVCPFLKTAIPQQVWRKWVCLIVHPGPPHDRGPSSLDWAISANEPTWGVTVLRAAEEMDGGDIYAWRTFAVPVARKSAIYNGPVADAAVACVLEALDKAGDETFTPTPLAEAPRPVTSAQERPVMRQTDRAFDWNDPVEHIVRRIRAADGAPGVRAALAGGDYFLYDAHPGLRKSTRIEPGTIVSRLHHGVEVAVGDGTIWLGHLRARAEGPERRSCKAPAAAVLARAGVALPAAPGTWGHTWTDLRYERHGAAGVLTFDVYNGAMTSNFCRRLVSALRFALAQDTRVLLLRHRGPYFSNGLHLGAIEVSANPQREAWDTIRAINEVARVLLEATPAKLTIAAVGGNAGAGGAMLALCADVVVAAETVVWNPHYATMGLPGSEFHTLTLPRRVGEVNARRLLGECRPIDTTTARDMGMVDEIAPAAEFDEHVLELARRYSDERRWRYAMSPKWDRLTREVTGKPLDAYEAEELGQMGAAIFGDKWGFAAKRADFLSKTPAPRAAAPALAVGRAG